MSITGKWNIKDDEGDQIIKNIINKISFIEKVNKDEVPLLFKKMSKGEGIVIKKNDKNRNINSYIRYRFNNYDNMLNSMKTKLYNFDLQNKNYTNNYIVNTLSDNKKNNDDDDKPPIIPNFFEILFVLGGLTGLFFFFVKKKR